MTVLFSIFVFVLGSIVGSFLNVCIHRFPREESIVKPGSHCPNCNRPIQWQDNIPLISYLQLGGKCRNCAQPISIRYVLVELATGILWLWLWFRFGFTLEYAAAVILISILLAVTVTDFETGFIPDALTFPGMAAGLIFSAMIPHLQDEIFWYRGLMQSAIGLVIGGGILLLLGILGNWIFKKDSMGGGDIKLLAMLGAFAGPHKVLWIFLLAPVISLPFALYMKLFKKAETIPFGPFLALTGAAIFLYGKEIIALIFPQLS